MQRQYPVMSRFGGGTSRIRKRVSSTSSSVSASSSLLQNYGFQRAVMVGKRGGSTTPAPNWRVDPTSPSLSSRSSVSSRRQGPVSARKLANALWELNNIPSSRNSESLSTRRSKKIPKFIAHRLSDPSHSPVSERSERSRTSSHVRVVPMVSQRVRNNDRNRRAFDLLSSASLMEIDARSQSFTPTSSTGGTKNCLKDLKDGLISSKELLKYLSRIWGQRDQQSYGLSIFSALRDELDLARAQVDQLIQEREYDQNKINCLKKRFMEEKSSWKIKEREKIELAIHSALEELESEKRLRRRAERLNKKLGLELANTRETLSKAMIELEDERRSREMIEQICNEVVNGIGDDREEVEHLKRESAKVREELEKEREMLQLADEWREERVHMKLLEAKAQFEEKNAAVDMLRNELESFLETKRSRDMKQVEERRGEEEEEDESESLESDLHSIELNMESNKVWSSDEKLVGFAEEKERRSFENNSSGEKDVVIDAEDKRDIFVNEPREHIKMAKKIVLPQGLLIPCRKWNRNDAFENKVDRLYEGLKVSEIVKAIREGGSGSKG